MNFSIAFSGTFPSKCSLWIGLFSLSYLHGFSAAKVGESLCEFGPLSLEMETLTFICILCWQVGSPHKKVPVETHVLKASELVTL